MKTSAFLFAVCLASSLFAQRTLVDEGRAALQRNDADTAANLLEKAVARGVSRETLQTLRHAGIDLERWLRGFASPEDGVRESVALIRQHPLLPKSLPVHGLSVA